MLYNRNFLQDVELVDFVARWPGTWRLSLSLQHTGTPGVITRVTK